MTVLLIPIAFFLILLLAIVGLSFRKWRFGCGLFFFAMFIGALGHILPLHHKHYQREGLFKVLFLNVHAINHDFRNSETFQLLECKDIDLVCLCEHYYPYSSSLDSLISDCGFHIQPDYKKALKADGTVFYSKSYLTEVVNLQRSSTSSDFIYNTKLSLQNDSIDIYLCHLASNNILVGTETRAPADSIHSYSQLLPYLNNVSAASEVRREEAQVIIGNIDCRNPAIILGDMNDVWGSGALRTFKKAGFRDAWWDGGFGYGATIHHPLPFRIDHILYNDKLKLRTIKRIKTHGLSDHDALVATFDFK